jgi:streptomycin 3"-adenylyltransferase
MQKYELLLKTISEHYLTILTENLVGIYVHGSIAFNCFNFENSDIDFIVVVNNALTIETKLKLLEVLENLKNQAPQKGFEMSVILKKHCLDFKYPTPYELHFSNGWLERYLENPLVLCNDDYKTDKDLAAHFTIIKHVGIVLCGLPISNVFGDVKREYYIDSIKNDIEDSKSEILNNPIYIILNLCRVLAYLKDDLILSKAEGGEWGTHNLPEKYLYIVNKALYCYTHEATMTSDENIAFDYCDYMLSKIFS